MHRGIVFSIICSNSKVTQAGLVPFPDEITASAAAAPTDDHADLCASTRNAKFHVNANARIIFRQMTELKLQTLPGSVPMEWKLTMKTSTPRTSHHPQLPRGDGTPINLWWSKIQAGMFKGTPFRLGHIMSLNRFQAIHKAIRYTNKPAPEDFVNKFHDVRQLVIG